LMRVLVSDTSVLIDLERGNLLEAAFRLSCDLAVPDLLYRRELRDQNGPALIAMGLRVEELDSEGIGLAQTYRSRNPCCRCRIRSRWRWRKPAGLRC